MKKLFIILIICVCVLQSGCNKDKNKEVSTQQGEIAIVNDDVANTNTTPNNSLKVADTVEVTDIAYENEMNLYKKISFDKETDMGKLGFSDVSLYTDATLDENGEIMWDDGQSFELLVHSDKGIFQIIPKSYIQFGTIEFSTFIKMDTGSFSILVTIPAGASYSIFEYTYDIKTNNFLREEVYLADNINWLESR